MMEVTAALYLILLHAVDGHEIAINPKQVTSLHSGPGAGDNKLVTEKARCVVMLTDGKFISVVETCDAVKQLLEDTK